MEKNKGIILKSYQPQKCKISLLDADIGKIMAVPNRDNLGNGACISYYLVPQTNIFFMRDIEIIDMPLALGKDDILFVHHILELCYYFIPSNNSISDIFKLLVLLYQSRHVFENTFIKKVFLFQLFAALGLYPEKQTFQQSTFVYLASTSIDRLFAQSIDVGIEKELDIWLLQCISSHPCIENFKTINFLHDNRCL